MTYKETCQYLFKQMPMFEKQGATAYKEGLENTLALDEHFGHPHQNYRCIHIAGTNGKGSCAHTLSAILQQCGYRVGLYTSPHLVDFKERIRINGEPIDEEYVVNFVAQEKAFFEPLKPSFFELTTALAFKYFNDSKIDLAVIEVGLGGRLDCTNIIIPVLSVITNISFDHMQQLGNSLEQIAMEKAGIIKKGVPVVIGETTPETRMVFEAMAQEQEAPITFAEDHPEVIKAEPESEGIHYKTLHYGQFTGQLQGLYQEKNTNTILTAVQQLEALGYLYPSNSRNQAVAEVTKGFGHVCELTGLQGRWQTVMTEPRVVCDTGHNVGGWQYLSRQLAQVDCKQMHIVFGMVEDKDTDGVMDLLPKNAVYYFTKSDNKRSISENVLKILGMQHGLSGESYPGVVEAWKAAKNAARNNDFVFIGGSSYIVADFLEKCI